MAGCVKCGNTTFTILTAMQEFYKLREDGSLEWEDSFPETSEDIEMPKCYVCGETYYGEE